MLNRYVLPGIDHVQLAKLGPQHVQAIMRGLEGRGLSAATRRQARAILRRALRDAERWGFVTRNAAALVNAPRSEASKLDDVLSLDEARALLDTARGTRLEALVTVVLAIGLRKGEALALRWEDVDTDAGTLTVRGTLKRRPGVGLVLDTPKTERGRRTIPLPTICLTVLRDHRRRQLEDRLAAGELWQDRGHIFATPVGTPVDPDNLTKQFHALCEQAGIARRRFHALRHSAATLMLAMGTPLEVISKTLGHAGYAITADVYARVVPQLQREAAEAMDRALGARA
jgi:integrase